MARRLSLLIALFILVPAVGCRHRCCKSNTSYAPPPFIPADDCRK